MYVITPNFSQWCVISVRKRSAPRRVSRLDFFGRFLLSGAFNTLLTYVLYLSILRTLGHRWSYAVAFATGILLAYVLNRTFVFKTHAGRRTLLAMPLIYTVQFGLGLTAVEVWTAWLHWPATLAPLGAIAVTLPCTYLLSRYFFIVK